MLRKKLAVLLAATMVVATMAGCGGAKEEAAAPAATEAAPAAEAEAEAPAEEAAPAEAAETSAE